ncbi:flagellar basal-body MS-ring/collar protein FliF [Paludibaculum fermentans]|uniref:Flagellar M-ring protein n=1 Tax=Paludibaculum fermentans TaxID=1473598 RepID=A0A7S7NT23_PALFE|nr:flagellar basal-body MS-ring/collar protein FliF [Paludibaculum fermentans]QOY89262.1 flagellar M-ring protein FliF [Paludibaculum fermentans]
MGQFKQILAGLTLRQRLVILVATAAVVAGIVFGIHWNKERDLRPLFTEVSAEDSGALVERLKAANVAYKVADNGTILVPSARVAELRIEMAAAGLPRTGRLGFELFDKTNLGTTDFAEHVNFRRALEGELERSVISLAEVDRARVHVTFAKESVFADTRQPAKASVMLRLRPGAKLSAANVVAIQHLTSSAVEGLAPESVSVLDMSGNLLSKPHRDADSDTGNSSAMLEFRQGLERDYLAKIRSTLDPLLGSEKYRAGISLECDFTSGEQSEEVFDPNRSVMLTSQKTEDASGLAATAGVPGAASNLPRPVPRAGSSGGGVSRKTENVSYQTSRTIKHLKLPLGTVKRLSVSILLDQALRWEGTGPKARRVLEPLSPDTLKIVKDVVAGTVGFQAERGDALLVETLPFEATLALPPPEAPPSRQAPAVGPSGYSMPAWMKPLLDKAPLPVWLGAAFALLVVLGVVIFIVMRGLIRRRRPTVHAVEAGAPQLQGSPPKDEKNFEEQAMAVMAGNQSEQDRVDREALLSLQMPPQTKKAEVLKKVIMEESKRDPAATAQLIRTWLSEQRS